MKSLFNSGSAADLSPEAGRRLGYWLRSIVLGLLNAAPDPPGPATTGRVNVQPRPAQPERPPAKQE